MQNKNTGSGRQSGDLYDSASDRKYNIKKQDEYMNAASTYDCTGLIPANPPLDSAEDEMEVYKEIYPYGPPDMKGKQNKE